MNELDLTNHFLIAMPAMQEGVFAGTLTYICEHNENGALGIVVNRPTSITVADMFDQISIPLHQPELEQLPVHFGGPVQTERGFVLHDTQQDWQSTLRIGKSMALTTSKDILGGDGCRQGPASYDHQLGLCRMGAWSAGT